MPRLKSCWRIDCVAGTAESLLRPTLGDIGIGHDIGRWLDGIGAEQLSRAAKQSTDFVELLLQRRIGHVPTLPRP